MSRTQDDDDLWPICKHIKGVWIRREGWPVTHESRIFIGHHDNKRLADAIASFKAAKFRIVGPAKYPWQDEIEIRRPVPSARHQ